MNAISAPKTDETVHSHSSSGSGLKEITLQQTVAFVFSHWRWLLVGTGAGLIAGAMLWFVQPVTSELKLAYRLSTLPYEYGGSHSNLVAFSDEIQDALDVIRGKYGENVVLRNEISADGRIAVTFRSNSSKKSDAIRILFEKEITAAATERFNKGIAMLDSDIERARTLFMDIQTRQSKAQQNGLDLSDAIVQYILVNQNRDARELLSRLERFKIRIASSPVNLSSKRENLRGLSMVAIAVGAVVGLFAAIFALLLKHCAW